MVCSQRLHVGSVLRRYGAVNQWPCQWLAARIHLAKYVNDVCVYIYIHIIYICTYRNYCVNLYRTFKDTICIDCIDTVDTYVTYLHYPWHKQTSTRTLRLVSLTVGHLILFRLRRVS